MKILRMNIIHLRAKKKEHSFIEKGVILRNIQYWKFPSVAYVTILSVGGNVHAYAVTKLNRILTKYLNDVTHYHHESDFVLFFSLE